MKENPFDVLGIAPTLRADVIKRAYFTLLARHPPHADPVGFARLRAAYDALGTPAARTAFVLSAPLDRAALWEARASEAELAEARAAQMPCVEHHRTQRRIAGFVYALAETTLDEALERVPR